MVGDAIPFVVIDTDVLSYLFKGDSRSEPFRRFMENRWGLISGMGRAELYLWAEARNWGETRRWDLRTFIEGYETAQ